MHPCICAEAGEKYQSVAHSAGGAIRGATGKKDMEKAAFDAGGVKNDDKLNGSKETSSV